MGRRSPQEKKALSYAKDRRNTYGENDKASRKAIPLRKRLVNRANRHDQQQRLNEAVGTPDADAADAVEEAVLGRRPKRWRKARDTPLAVVVERAQRRREALEAVPRKSDEARARRTKSKD